MFGKHLNETIGKIHFWITIIGFNVCMAPLFVLGAAGQHRRIYDYSNFPELATPWMQNIRVIATTGLIVMLAAQLLFLINLIISFTKGRKAEANPYNANTLEWVAPSPPPHGNFAEMPNCYRAPYEYSVPGRDSDFWPQNEPT
jgi:cytochrome c oxidase subunit 1